MRAALTRVVSRIGEVPRVVSARLARAYRPPAHAAFACPKTGGLESARTLAGARRRCGHVCRDQRSQTYRRDSSRTERDRRRLLTSGAEAVYVGNRQKTPPDASQAFVLWIAR